MIFDIATLIDTNDWESPLKTIIIDLWILRIDNRVKKNSSIIISFNFIVNYSNYDHVVITVLSHTVRSGVVKALSFVWRLIEVFDIRIIMND